MKKFAVIALILLLTALLAAGCGPKEKKIVVADQGTEITVIVKQKATVADALAAAGIKVNEKDVVTPGLNETPADGARVEISRWASVSVIMPDGEEKTVELIGATVADALREVGITLAEGQSLNMPEDAMLSDVKKPIEIITGLTVTFTADGKTETVPTSAATVEAFLKEQKVEYTEDDRLTPDAKTRLTDGMEITLKRVEVKEETETEKISYSTETESSATLEKGKTETKRAGENGEKEVTYKVTYVDGKEESREKVSEKVTKEPVSAIVVSGTKEPAPTEAPTEATTEAPTAPATTERYIVSKEDVPDCDGKGGYYVITWSDGDVEYVEYTNE